MVMSARAQGVGAGFGGPTAGQRDYRLGLRFKPYQAKEGSVRRRRIEITILRRTVVRYDRSCSSSAAQPYNVKESSRQDCDDSSQTEELDGTLDERPRPLPVRKETPVDSS